MCRSSERRTLLFCLLFPIRRLCFWFSFLQLIGFPKGGGGTACLFFEQAAEIAGVAEAAGFYDFAYGHMGSGQVFLGGGDAAGGQVAHDGGAGDALELVGEGGDAQIQFFCQLLQGYGCGQVLFEAALDPVHGLEGRVAVGAQQLRETAADQDQQLLQLKGQHFLCKKTILPLFLYHPGQKGLQIRGIFLHIQHIPEPCRPVEQQGENPVPAFPGQGDLRGNIQNEAPVIRAASGDPVMLVAAEHRQTSGACLPDPLIDLDGGGACGNIENLVTIVVVIRSFCGLTVVFCGKYDGFHGISSLFSMVPL